MYYVGSVEIQNQNIKCWCTADIDGLQGLTFRAKTVFFSEDIRLIPFFRFLYKLSVHHATYYIVNIVNQL